MPVTPNSLVTPQAPITGTGVMTAAQTSYGDTVSNAVQVLPSQTNGARITKVTAIPRATVSATQMQLYVSSNGGTTLRLINTALMAAYSMAQTTQAPVTDFGYAEVAPLILAAGESLWMASGVALTSGIVGRVEGAAY